LLLFKFVPNCITL